MESAGSSVGRALPLNAAEVGGSIPSPLTILPHFSREQLGLPERRTITIPAPLALNGDRVLVRNYHMRPAEWEDGELASATYRPGYTAHFLDRPPHQVEGRRSGGYVICVGDEGLRPLQ